MQLTTTCFLVLLFSYGTRFKMHHQIKVDSKSTNQETIIDMDDYWPFKSTLEKGDPYLSEIFLSQPPKHNFKRNEKAMISSMASIF